MKHHSVIMKLIEENNINVFAEIGVWRSRMIKWVLRSDCSNILEEYWAVDKWDVLGPGYGRMSRISYDRWTDLYVYSCGLMRYFKQLKVLRLSSERACGTVAEVLVGPGQTVAHKQVLVRFQ